MPRNTARRSTVNSQRRVALILATGSEMPNPCGRCKKEGLRCVVELTTGYCAYCIRAKARCSLVFSDTERKELDDQQRATQLRIARAEAELAAAKLLLLEVGERRRQRELEEIAATEELERLEDAAGMPKELPSPEPVARTADLDFLDPEPLADLGWSQADFTSFVDPAFLDASLLLQPWDFELGGSFGGTYSPVPELPVSSGA